MCISLALDLKIKVWTVSKQDKLLLEISLWHLEVLSDNIQVDYDKDKLNKEAITTLKSRHKCVANILQNYE